MKFTFVNLTAALIIFILFFGACRNSDSDGNSNQLTANSISETNSANANASRDDVEELGKIIKLPLEPEESTYWEENLPQTDADKQKSAANAKKITAVLKYSPANSNQLAAYLEKTRLPTDSKIDVESRFPAELIAQSQLSGDETLKGKSYAAEDFFQPPYNSGKITRIENADYFILELTTD